MIDYSIEDRGYRKGQKVRTNMLGFTYKDIGTIIFYSERYQSFLVSFSQETVERSYRRFHRGNHDGIFGYIYDTATCVWITSNRLHFLPTEDFNDEEYESMLV